MARRISEDDLLAFIEGDLPEERRDEVRRALEAEPDLLEWAEGAQTDRSMLQDWGRAGASIAPPDLVEQAMRQAERDALLGAAGLDEDHRPRVLFRFTGPRTALAAMLVAAVGLGVIYGPGLVQQWTGSPAPPPSGMPDAGRAEPLAESSPVEESRMARGPGERNAGQPDALGAAPVGARQREDGATQVALADEVDDAPSMGFDDSGRDANGVPASPLALAQAGVDESFDRESERLAKASDDADGAGSSAPTGLRAIGAEEEAAAAGEPASLTLADAAALAAARRLLVAVEAPDVAAFEAGVQASEAALRISPLEGQGGGEGVALLVEISPGVEGLDAFLQALGSLGAESVRLAERDGALGAGTVRGADDVLWWRRPPSDWPGVGSALELRVVAGPNLPAPPAGD